jgi:hypothetical protein
MDNEKLPELNREELFNKLIKGSGAGCCNYDNLPSFLRSSMHSIDYRFRHFYDQTKKNAINATMSFIILGGVLNTAAYMKEVNSLTPIEAKRLVGIEQIISNFENKSSFEEDKVLMGIKSQLEERKGDYENSSELLTYNIELAEAKADFFTRIPYILLGALALGSLVYLPSRIKNHFKKRREVGELVEEYYN